MAKCLLQFLLFIFSSRFAWQFSFNKSNHFLFDTQSAYEFVEIFNLNFEPSLFAQRSQIYGSVNDVGRSAPKWNHSHSAIWLPLFYERRSKEQYLI